MCSPLSFLRHIHGNELLTVSQYVLIEKCIFGKDISTQALLKLASLAIDPMLSLPERPPPMHVVVAHGEVSRENSDSEIFPFTTDAIRPLLYKTERESR